MIIVTFRNSFRPVSGRDGAPVFIRTGKNPVPLALVRLLLADDLVGAGFLPPVLRIITDTATSGADGTAYARPHYSNEQGRPEHGCNAA